MPSAQLLDCLATLVAAPGVSGAEQPVAAAITGLLEPAGFAASDFQRDELGNRWLAFGPDDAPPRRLLIAHMDEIGLRVSSIRGDGMCHVVPVGGLDPQLWEGTKVLVHTRQGAVPGCIAPVSHHISYSAVYADKRRIGAGELVLDVGAANAEGVSELGIRLLDTVTWEKQLTDLPAGVVQGRSLDDRFGCCALVMLARQLRDRPPEVPTVVAWSVQEEVGLKGAEALARRFGDVEEVIAVDSFTVGTGPRDIKTYDSARLGGGAVLRSWDARMLVPDAVRDALLSKAERLGHDLQYGYMPGGNDAATFLAGDTRRLCFSVPLQYSHSAVERISLSDLEGLIALLADWCAMDTKL